jgi:hypothetical protein
MVGTLESWHEDFGFVVAYTKTGARRSYFLHRSEVKGGVPKAGAKVEFTVGLDWRGLRSSKHRYPQAIDAKILTTSEHEGV